MRASSTTSADGAAAPQERASTAVRAARECGERRGVDSAAAAVEHAFPPLNVTLTNDVVSRNIPRAPRAAALREQNREREATGCSASLESVKAQQFYFVTT
eukprot:2936084-Pleurochrysis_carterae.AAC.2